LPGRTTDELPIAVEGRRHYAATRVAPTLPDTLMDSARGASSDSVAVGDANGDSRSSIRARPYRVLQVAVLAAPLVMLALAGWTHRWIFDDGFIYLRVVRQIRVGHGPVFNTGQRVEAFTSPLWVGVLAFADLVTPIRLEWLAVLLGITGSVAGAAFATFGTMRLARRVAPDEFLLPAGVLVFLALIPMWYFESAGLETGLTFAWLGLCCWILASWASTSHGKLSAPAAITLGLGWLVRPELVVDSAVFLVVVSLVQWRDGNWRRRTELALWMLALPVAYEIFRMGYYGSLVANTALAKEGSRLRLGAGWSYLLDFVVPYWLWLPVGLLILGVYLPLGLQFRRRGESRSVWVLLAFLFASVGNAAAVVSFGGDYLHARLLLPALFTLCSPVAVVPATKRYLASLAILGWAFICAVALRPPELKAVYHYRGGIPYGFPQGCCGHVTLTELGWGKDSPRRSRFVAPAVYVSVTVKGYRAPYVRVDDDPAPALRLPTVATGGIGALSYALGPRVSILDLNGLADPIAARLELVRRGYPGHEKILPAPWVAALVTAVGTNPRPEEFPIKPSTSTPVDTDLPFDVQVQYARAALRCPAIAGIQHSTQGSLGVGKFMSNIVHSFARTSLRIPSDPRLAAARFCPARTSSLPSVAAQPIQLHAIFFPGSGVGATTESRRCATTTERGTTHGRERTTDSDRSTPPYCRRSNSARGPPELVQVWPPPREVRCGRLLRRCRGSAGSRSPGTAGARPAYGSPRSCRHAPSA
jgi:arabinofuranosyltransferase